MNPDRTTDEWVSAYLEWTDMLPAGNGVTQASCIVVERRHTDRRGNGCTSAREATLLEALRAESDCVRLLRQALETARLQAPGANAMRTRTGMPG